MPSDRLAVLVAEIEMHEAHAAALKVQIEALGETLKADGAGERPRQEDLGPPTSLIPNGACISPTVRP